MNVLMRAYRRRRPVPVYTGLHIRFDGSAYGPETKVAYGVVTNIHYTKPGRADYYSVDADVIGLAIVLPSEVERGA